MKRPLTEDERTTITNGLRVAAERFDGHVKDLMDGDYHCVGGISTALTRSQQAGELGRLARQFETQAADSRELADLIDGAQEIEITPYVEAVHGSSR